MNVRTRDRDVPPGAGHPRLVQTTDGHAAVGSPEANGTECSYPLGIDVTSLGSAPHCDILLAGLDAEHAEIRREESQDEFVYRHLSHTGESRVNGVVVIDAGLHHGDRVSIGGWTLTYQRDEFADHGRFDGGRQGGDASGTRSAGSGGQESEPSSTGPIQ